MSSWQKFKISLTAVAFLAASVFASVVPAPAFAAASPFTNDACSGATQVAGGSCSGASSTNTINGVVRNAVNILSFIVGVTAIIVIIIDGLKLAASNGDTAAVSAARSGIVYALVALAVVSFAQVIVHFVLGHI